MVTALGSSLTISWASSYYIPAVPAVPMAEDLGLSPVWAFGAFPMATVISAMAGACAFALLHGTGNGMLTIAKGTLPLVLFGSAGCGARLGWLNAPARILQAAAPLAFGTAPAAWGLHDQRSARACSDQGCMPPEDGMCCCLIQIRATDFRPCAGAHAKERFPMILATLSALAEPTRLEAMRCLADGPEHCVCELMRKLGATQSRMSRHMQVLKEAGLVVDRRDAQWVRYRINPDLSPALVRLVEAALERPIVAREDAA